MFNASTTHHTSRSNPGAWSFRWAFVALLLFTGVAQAADEIPILVPEDGSCPEPLDVDGGRYVLTGDLACRLNPEGSNLTIRGSDIDLDLNGFTVSPPENNGGFVVWGIKVEGERANVHDGRVSGFSCEAREGTPVRQVCAGIVLGLPGSTVKRVVLDENFHGVLLFESFPGYFPTDSVIVDNSIFNNESAGIAFGSKSSGSVATRNTLLFNEYGAVVRVDGVRLIDNVASGNRTAGIVLDNGAKRNLVQNNTTVANGEAGIAVGGETEELRAVGNRLQRNSSFGNPVDLFDGVFGQVGSECLNRWMGNEFGVASPSCIW